MRTTAINPQFQPYDDMLQHPCAAEGRTLLIVVGEGEIRIYWLELRGAVPYRIGVYDPQGGGHGMRIVPDGSRRGISDICEQIAMAVERAAAIMVLARDPASADAATRLHADLKRHCRCLGSHIVGLQVARTPCLTERQLLAAARAYFAEIGT